MRSLRLQAMSSPTTRRSKTTSVPTDADDDDDDDGDDDDDDDIGHVQSPNPQFQSSADLGAEVVGLPGCGREPVRMVSIDAGVQLGLDEEQWVLDLADPATGGEGEEAASDTTPEEGPQDMYEE